MIVLTSAVVGRLAGLLRGSVDVFCDGPMLCDGDWRVVFVLSNSATLASDAVIPIVAMLIGL